MKNLLNNLSKSTLINMIEELSNNATTDYRYIRHLQEEVMTAEQIARDLQEDNDYFDTALARAYEQIAELTTIEADRQRYMAKYDNDEIPNLSWIDKGEEYYEKIAEQSIRDLLDDDNTWYDIMDTQDMRDAIGLDEDEVVCSSCNKLFPITQTIKINPVITECRECYHNSIPF